MWRSATSCACACRAKSCGPCLGRPRPMVRTPANPSPGVERSLAQPSMQLLRECRNRDTCSRKLSIFINQAAACARSARLPARGRSRDAPRRQHEGSRSWLGRASGLCSLLRAVQALHTRARAAPAGQTRTAATQTVAEGESKTSAAAMYVKCKGPSRARRKATMTKTALMERTIPYP